MPEPAPPAIHPPLLIVSVATGYGGAERTIETLLPPLLAQRRVEVLASNPLHLERLQRITHPGLSLHAVDATRGDFAAIAARQLVKRVLAVRPSALLTNTLDSLRILALATQWLPGLDALACVAAHDFLWFDHAALLPRVPGATLVVPDRSVLEKPDYLAGHVWPHGPMQAVVIPNPVDIPEAPAAEPGDDAPFLHLATLNGFKGHAALVAAAAVLKARCPGLRIVSAGHRPIPALERELMQQMAAADIAGTLRLEDHRPDPTALLRQARAVLVTSLSEHGGPETFSRAIIEAWAQGRPVIAFACGAPAQLIRHEVDGLLVDEGDVEGLAAAMERLHRDPALADRLGRNGLERAARDFATPQILAQWTAVLDGGWCVRHLPPPAGAGRSGAALLLDVSLTLELGWQSPVGMSRVERHTADHIAAQPVRVQLVRRSPEHGGYRRLTGQELEFLAGTADGLGRIADAELADAKLADGALPPPTRARPPGPVTRALASLQLTDPRLRRLIMHRLVPRRLIRRLERRVMARLCPAPLPAPPLTLAAGDVLLSVSNPWDYLAPSVFSALRAQGVRVVLAVHDLMVWETPQWTAGRDPRRYSADMLGTLEQADALVAVSQHTARQVERALAEQGRPVPAMRVAAPGGLDTAGATAGGPPPGLPKDRPFVLYCSTIEIRKNHILLLNLWEQLRATLPPERLPVLVLAGRWGWGVDAVRLAVERNWRLAPHVRVVPALRDEQLRWLYRHARFSVFPSFTEGFGLPVAESLALGTPVLVAAHPALLEASAGLMPALDPGDLPAWRAAVTRLCLDDTYLAQLRAKAGEYLPAPADLLPRALLQAAHVAP